jgi:hypothetical protein
VNDREYARARRRVERIFHRWRADLGLRWWSVRLEFERERHPRDSTETCVLGETTANWKYMNARIVFFLPEIAAMDDADLERSVVHELVHVLVNEMTERDEDDAHQERVVTTLTDAFIWTRGSRAGRPRGRIARGKR